MENIKFISASTGLPGSRQFLGKPLSCLNWYITRIFIYFDTFGEICFVFSAGSPATLPAAAPSTLFLPQQPPRTREPGRVRLLHVSVCGSWPAKVSHTSVECYTKTRPRKLRQEACIHSLITVPPSEKGKHFYTPCWYSRLVLPRHALCCYAHAMKEIQRWIPFLLSQIQMF